MREDGIRRVLAELLGEHGEVAYAGVKEIAEGKTTFEQFMRASGPEEDAHAIALIPRVIVQPTIRERLEAWKWLAEQQNGKAAVTVRAEVKQEPPPPPDYDALSDEELLQLEAMLAKVVKDQEQNTVDGELIE